MRRLRRIGWPTLTAFLAVLVILAFLARAAFASGLTNILLGQGSSYRTLSTTITAGSTLVSGTGYTGYCSNATDCGSASLGSISTSSIPGGYTIIGIDAEYASAVFQHALVVISGFSSSPGASWLGTVTFNSVNYVGSNATYSYSSGTATWTWTSGTGWAFVGSDVYPGSVQYQ